MSGVAFAKGFKSSGVACGLKKNGQKDLALVVCENMASVAGVFTKNVVKGHSLQLCRENVKQGKARAVVINSGCANACLGQKGYEDAKSMAEYVSNKIGANPSEVLTASTGVIGVPLNMDKLTTGIDEAVDALSYDGVDAAKAIMTTDTHEKIAQVEFELLGEKVRIGGMAKGSGMIHPNMATMISVITTDISINHHDLHDALKTCVDKTYNKISVDGDTSVCDKVLFMSSNMTEYTLKNGTKEYDIFIKNLNEICEKLSKMLAADGEGATKLLTIKVKNAITKEDANLITNAIAKSPLCKTAAFGNDANWGRLITAAGYSGAKFDQTKVNIFIGEVMVCKDGCGLAFDEEKALDVLKKDEVEYIIDLNDGDYNDTMWTCDLSYDYVKINGDYRT